MNVAVISHPCVTAINQDFYARVQRRTGWNLTILLPQRWKNEYGRLTARRWPAFEGRLCPLPVLLEGNIPLHFYAARLGALLRRLAPDAIYVHHEAYAAATAQAVAGARKAGPVALGFYSAQNLLKRYPWPVRTWERRVYARAQFALPVSNAVADVLRVKGYTGNIEVLPLSVDARRYHCDERSAPRKRSDDPFTVGYVGRLSAEKGVDTLLDAIPLIGDDRPTRVLVVGEGPAEQSLKQRAAALGVAERVMWHGYTAHEAMAPVYRRMDVLVVPSKTLPRWKEQFGRVVIEALASCVPVVTSDSGELPNLVLQTEGGWTFGEGDAAGLARILQHVRASGDAARAVGARGRAAVERLFDVDVLAGRFANVIEAAVRR